MINQNQRSIGLCCNKFLYWHNGTVPHRIKKKNKTKANFFRRNNVPKKTIFCLYIIDYNLYPQNIVNKKFINQEMFILFAKKSH